MRLYFLFKSNVVQQLATIPFRIDAGTLVFQSCFEFNIISSLPLVSPKLRLHQLRCRSDVFIRQAHNARQFSSFPLQCHGRINESTDLAARLATICGLFRPRFPAAASRGVLQFN